MVSFMCEGIHLLERIARNTFEAVANFIITGINNVKLGVI